MQVPDQFRHAPGASDCHLNYSLSLVSWQYLGEACDRIDNTPVLACVASGLSTELLLFIQWLSLTKPTLHTCGASQERFVQSLSLVQPWCRMRQTWLNYASFSQMVLVGYSKNLWTTQHSGRCTENYRRAISGY